MNHITIARTPKEVLVTTPQGELGFILGRPGDFEAWANLEPLNGFARASVQSFKRLRDAVLFVQAEGVA
jgi:hypothetical protein